VIYELGIEFKFKNIELEEGVYRGVLKHENIILYNPDTLELYLKNKPSSTWLTIISLIPVAIVTTFGLVLLYWVIIGPTI
jgi:hypothetical protein